jgi:ribosomal protein S18 acetylase RimI-like enzyme
VEVKLDNLRIRAATIDDIPGIVEVANTSMRLGEDVGFGGTGVPVNIRDVESEWKAPNLWKNHEIYIAELDDRIVGLVKLEDHVSELELVDIDVPIEFQGKGIGTRIVQFVEDRGRRRGNSAVTCGTSRNAEGVPWKSLPWWKHLVYVVTHE